MCYRLTRPRSQDHLHENSHCLPGRPLSRADPQRSDRRNSGTHPTDTSRGRRYPSASSGRFADSVAHPATPAQSQDRRDAHSFSNARSKALLLSAFIRAQEAQALSSAGSRAQPQPETHARAESSHTNSGFHGPAESLSDSQSRQAKTDRFSNTSRESFADGLALSNSQKARCQIRANSGSRRTYAHAQAFTVKASGGAVQENRSASFG